MISVLEPKPTHSWKAFGRGFADGIGSVGSVFALLPRRNSPRRSRSVEIRRRDPIVDAMMIRRDFTIALGKLNERRKEK